MTALDFMQQLVDAHVHETGGNNRGPVIDEINRELGLPMGSPYCAATVSHCFRKAAAEPGATGLPFPCSGGSQALKHSFAALGRLSNDPNALLSWRGALGGWTDSDDPTHGHVFFIKGRLTDQSGHTRGMSAHTWVVPSKQPHRSATSTPVDRPARMNAVAATHPARRFPRDG